MHSPRFDAHFKPKETQTLKDLFCAGVLAITIKYFAFRNGYFVNYTIIFCSGGNWPSGYDKRLDDQDVVSLK